MAGLQALREQKNEKAAAARNLLDQNTSAEAYAKVKAEVDALIADCAALDDQISAYEKLMRAEAGGVEASARAHAERTGLSVDEANHQLSAARRAFVNALRYGADGLTEEERTLVGAENNRPRLKNIMETPPATGGVLVPTIIMPELLVKLKSFGGMRDFARVISTAGGGPITWGAADDTAAEGEWLAEGVPATDDDIAFSTVSIGAFVISSKTIPVSLQILQDAAVDVESFVLDALATRIARGQNRKFTVGSGVNEPQGVITAAALGKIGAAGQTTSIAYDDFVDLEHSVDPAYRKNCSYMFHDSTLRAIRKMKDANGRPLWLPSVESAFANARDFASVNGYRYIINQHMATMAANAKSVLFGDGSKYLIRDVMEVLLLRFTDSVYAKRLQIGFQAFARTDGRLIDASNEALRYYQNAAA